MSSLQDINTLIISEDIIGIYRQESRLVYDSYLQSTIQLAFLPPRKICNCCFVTSSNGSQEFHIESVQPNFNRQIQLRTKNKHTLKIKILRKYRSHKLELNILFFSVFLWPCPCLIEVLRLGVESKLQLPTFATATAMKDLAMSLTYTTACCNAGSLSH